jgi:hypothetical protein
MRDSARMSCSIDRKADARHTYDRAVARMNETWSKSPDLLLMKAEAAKAMEMH